MADHDGHDEDGHGHDEHGDESGEWRTTSPMQAYTSGQVRTGFLVTVVGLALTFGIALALA